MLRQLWAETMRRGSAAMAAGSAGRIVKLETIQTKSMHITSVNKMPVSIHSELPAFEQLKNEGAWIVPSNRNTKELMGLPRVKIGMMNLMPIKPPTEAQICRMLAGSSALVEITLFVPDTYHSKNTPPEYISKHYKRWSQVKDRDFDGFIITGAPIEHLPFEQVSYWPELTQFFDHVKANNTALLSLCWGAMAALYHYYKVPKYGTPRKLFGVFPHSVNDPPNVLLQALPSTVSVPVSRHTTWKREDIESIAGLQILLDSNEVGPGLIWDAARVHAHMQNHFEYDADTLHSEYVRDLKSGTPTGEPIHVPSYYYPDDDPSKTPLHSWKPHGQAFYGNWVNAILRRKFSS